jgi:hypothetical protein
VESLPVEIQDYYRDYNFVNAFSTPGERLVAMRRGDPEDQRLSRVAAAMRRLAESVDEIDPKIFADRGMHRSPITQRADLLRLTWFELDPARGEALLHLETLKLDGTANITLISKYDELAAPETELSVERLAAATGSTLIRTFEMHRWRRIDGAWRREAATRHLIAR